MGWVFRGHWVLRLVMVPVAAAVVAVGVMVPVAAAAVTGKPGAPTGVMAVPRAGGAVVSWTPPSSDGGSPITGYVITASPGGKTVRTVAVTSYLVGGLTNGTSYTFTVAAVNTSGKGPASSPSAAVTPQPATVPGRVRSVTASAGFEQVSVSWVAPKSDGGAPVTGYRLTTSPATQAVTVSGGARSATVTGLSDGTTYQVRAAAVNSAGRGKAGASSSVTPQVTVPGAPVGVTAASVKSGVKVSWQPPLSDGGSAVSGYVVTVTGTGQTVAAGASARSATVTGLTSGTSYAFTVAAANAQGPGPGQASTPAIAGGTVGAATVVLSAASLAALTTVRTDGSLVFTSPPSQVQNLTAGDTVVAGVSTLTPDGLLAKVTSVSTSGSTVTVSTTPASLDDALSAAGFGTSTSLTEGQVAKFVPARPGVRLLAPGQAPASAAPGSISLGLDTNLYKSADGRTITVNGSVSLSPSVSFWASISCCVHTASQFTGSVTAGASLSVTAQVSHDISGGYTLGTFRFTPIEFDVLGVPVVIVPELTVKLIAKGSVTAGLTAGAGESVTVGAQVTTKDSQVSAHPFTSRTTTYTPPTLYGSLDAAGGVEADLSATVDGVAGATLTDQLWLAELSVNPSQTPWWTLSLENVIGVDFDLTLLHRTFGSYHKTLSDTTVRLDQANDPYQGITITPSPAVIAPGGTLQLSAQVAGSAVQNVTWGAPTGNGTITAGGLYTAPSTPGTYQVTATQPASGLRPGAYGLLSIQVGDQPPGPPTNPSATSTSYGAATITWKPPADTGGGTITGYTITAAPGGDTYPVAGTATSDTIGGLNPGATYTFTITANSHGGTSIPSASTNPVVIDNVPGSGGWTATEAPLPNGVPASTSGSLTSVACPAPASCTAVGIYDYDNSVGGARGWLVTGAGGSWTAIQAPAPTGAGTDSPTDLYSVACPSAAGCVAVGEYVESSSYPLLEIGASASWQAVEAPLPTNASADNPNASLDSVACPSTTWCVAVGSYTDTLGNTQGLLVTGYGTSWTATEAPLPANAWTSGNLQVGLNDVSCASTSVCVAAGWYPDSSFHSQGLLVTGSGTSWKAAESPLPGGASSNPGTDLASVTCPSTSKCVVAGHYNDSSDDFQGVLVTGLGASWTAFEAPSASSELYGGLLESVACPSTTFCTATGYFDGSGGQQGMLATGSGTSWTAAESPLPANAASNPAAELDSVACPSTSTCVATGDYWFSDTNNGQEGMLVAGSGSSWTAAEAPLPADADSYPGASLTSVSCPSTAACAATGSYTSSSGYTDGLIVTGSP